MGKVKMKFYKVALWKAYFEKGYSITSYVKYLIAIIGITGVPAKYLLPLFFVYGASCFLIGRWVYRSGFADAEKEVTNKIDPFVKQMRNSKIFKHSK